jgi:type II secretory pathway pseudopilin PulG
MILNFKKKSAFTLIETIIAISISSFLILGMVLAFQNFSSYHAWLMQVNFVNEQSSFDLSAFQKFYQEEIIKLKNTSLTENYQGVSSFLSRNKNNLVYQYFSGLKDKKNGLQSDFTDSEAYPAVHKNVFFSDMCLVGTDLFIVDTGYHIIRKIDMTDFSASIYAGKIGEAGYLDSLNSLQAKFRNPTGIAHYNGKLYLTDTGNHIIRTITLAPLPENRTVELFAGSPNQAGDFNSTLLNSNLAFPTGIAIDENNGEVYFSDTFNHTLKKITNNQVVSLIGKPYPGNNGTIAEGAEIYDFLLNTPLNLAYDSNLKYLYINDYLNQRILRLTGSRIEKITNEKEYYGDLNIYEDGVYRYLDFQKQKNGSVYQYDQYTDSLKEIIDLESFSTYYDPNTLEKQYFKKYNYFHTNFLRYNNNFVWAGYTKDEYTEKTVYFLQENIKKANMWYGITGIKGQVKNWSEKDYLFTDNYDYLSNLLVNYLYFRDNNPSFYQVLLRYFKDDIIGNEDLFLDQTLILN